MSEYISAFLLLCYTMFGIWMYRKIKAGQQETKPEPEPDPDFAFLSVREQVETVRQTSETLSDLESLQLDLEESNADSLLPVHLEWMSRDGTVHAVEVYANGTDLTTESLHRMTEGEIHDTRKVLSYQCQVLASSTRSRKNSRKNDMWTGGEDVEKVLRDVRGSHPDR